MYITLVRKMRPRLCSAFWPGLMVPFVAGCIGPVDSIHRVTGNAPSDAKCEVSVREADSAYVLARKTVKDSFAVIYQASGPFPSSVDIVANCNGITTRELKAISPRSSKDVDLGNIAH